MIEIDDEFGGLCAECLAARAALSTPPDTDRED